MSPPVILEGVALWRTFLYAKTALLGLVSPVGVFGKYPDLTNVVHHFHRLLVGRNEVLLLACYVFVSPVILLRGHCTLYTYSMWTLLEG